MDFSELTDAEKMSMMDETIDKLVSLSLNPNLTEPQTERLQANLEKIETIKNLYKKIDSESTDDIRKKYLMIAKERNVYFEKLRQLEQLGEVNNWNDDTGIVQKILSIMNKIKTNEGED